MSSINADNRSMTITRTINAPRELVWKAWTDPKHLIQWWGPNGFTNTFNEISVKPGGVWDFMMHGPDGVDYPNYIVFDEIVEPERIAFTHGSKANDPQAFQSTATFEDIGGKTKVTLHSVFGTVEQFEEVKKFGAVEGGNQTLGRLETYVATL